MLKHREQIGQGYTVLENKTGLYGMTETTVAAIWTKHFYCVILTKCGNYAPNAQKRAEISVKQEREWIKKYE